MIRIHNSLTGQKEDLDAHHARAAAHVRVRSYRVRLRAHRARAHAHGVRRHQPLSAASRVSPCTYVRNITDIDDKIIRRAAELGEPIGAFTERFIQAMHEDCAALGILPPDARAARHRSSCRRSSPWSQELLARDYAYVAANGDVMYAVARFAGYGRLSGKRLADLRAGARVEVDEAKRDPLDFVLWKHAKPGRAGLGVALGSRAARLAHRVLGDVHRAARHALRPARRRHGPQVPAPRERDRAVLRGQRRRSS